ncbi:mannose-1-phosphate guanylyltransferase/mannose-6-phosphate isomerase [Brevirhabdus sp.]|uniref:mannose-1-phosphate guanylyltransferase/mannose-6-phosphate isomerase n=1 Tax=Brevirhabdus sp. TaxID=2004514 RepID=UPI0040592E72
MIHPILLCGGSGTRLWPVSRPDHPKQFAALSGRESLFQASARRFAAAGFADPLILTGEVSRFTATAQLEEAGIAPRAVLIEPAGRDTAPAVLIAALWLAREDPDALMLVSPADHEIPDAEGFRDAVLAGVGAARAGRLVTFGIRPDRAETGYGYLRLDAPLEEVPDGGAADPRPLAGFVEKPCATRAAAMLASGDHLWNAGIFLFTARAILDAFAAHAPDLIAPARAALEGARADLDFLRLAAAPWAELPHISLDYAVMERAENLCVVPFSGRWSDMGGWDAVWRHGAPDARGVVTLGLSEAVDCTDSLLRSEPGGPALVGLGLSGVVAVATGDAVLVADKSRAQEVRVAVERLDARGAPQARKSARDHRPWGWFETLALGPRFQVKRIVVRPGGVLSLQSHVHRAEHWIVVSGTARVTLGDQTRLVGENESVYIPLGTRHRLENPGKLPMILIEVQTGAYLGEDDITRHEDIYRRM